MMEYFVKSTIFMNSSWSRNIVDKGFDLYRYYQLQERKRTKNSMNNALKVTAVNKETFTGSLII